MSDATYQDHHRGVESKVEDSAESTSYINVLVLVYRDAFPVGGRPLKDDSLLVLIGSDARVRVSIIIKGHIAIECSAYSAEENPLSRYEPL